MIKHFTFSLSLALSFATTAFAARMPNADDHTFQVHGQPAVEIAELLGMDTRSDSKLVLELTMDEWVCTAKECGPRGEKSNVFEFSPKDGGLLTLSGQWVDAETGSGEKMPQYTFYSPKFSVDSQPDSPWGGLLKRLAPKADGKAQFLVKVSELETTEDTQPYFAVTAYSESNGTAFRIRIGYDDRPLNVRKERARAYEKCLESWKGNQSDGGC